MNTLGYPFDSYSSYAQYAFAVTREAELAGTAWGKEGGGGEGAAVETWDE
jgi:hypothetical protein